MNWIQLNDNLIIKKLQNILSFILQYKNKNSKEDNQENNRQIKMQKPKWSTPTIQPFQFSTQKGINNAKKINQTENSFPFKIYDQQLKQTSDLYPNQNKSLFKTNQFNNVPMIDSIDGQYAQLFQSQIIQIDNGQSSNKKKLSINQNNKQYAMSQYQQNFNVEKNGINNSYSKNFKNVFIKSNNKFNIHDIAQSTNIPHVNTNNTIPQSPQSNQQSQVYEDSNKKLISLSKQIVKSHQIQLSNSQKDNVNTSNQKQKVQSSGFKKIKNNTTIQKAINDTQLSQVKNRLDSLMRRYPVKSISQTSNQQAKRSKSTDHNNIVSYEFKLKNNNTNDLPAQNAINIINDLPLPLNDNDDNSQTQTHRNNFVTEQKIKDNPIKIYNLAKIHQSQHIQEGQLNQYRNQVQKLQKQLDQQQNVILEYQRMIFKLQNQNSKLVQIIQQNSYNYHISYTTQGINQYNSRSSHFPQRIRMNNDLVNKQAYSEEYMHRNNYQNMQKNENNQNLQIDSIHKFQRQDIIKDTKPQNLSQRLLKQEKKSVKFKNSNNFIQKKSSQQSSLKQSIQNINNEVNSNQQAVNNLLHKVQILQQQKKQFLNKIDWLNSVIEQMMNMGNKIKSDKSIIFDPTSQYSNNSKYNHSRQHSGNIVKKQQKQLQTSLIYQNGLNYSSINNGFQANSYGNNVPDSVIQKNSQNYYKTMYQKSIKNQSYLVNEMQKIQKLQQLYANQFKLIIKQINEIKDTRNYYKQLKKQIKERTGKNNQGVTKGEGNYHSKYDMHYTNKYKQELSKNLNKYDKSYKNYKNQRTKQKLSQSLNHAHQNQNKSLDHKLPQTHRNQIHQSHKYKATKIINNQSSIHQQSPRHQTRKIFQNHIIYELKKQNQLLLQRYNKLNQLYKKQKQKNQYKQLKTINPQTILLPEPKSQQYRLWQSTAQGRSKRQQNNSNIADRSIKKLSKNNNQYRQGQRIKVQKQQQFSIQNNKSNNKNYYQINRKSEYKDQKIRPSSYGQFYYGKKQQARSNQYHPQYQQRITNKYKVNQDNNQNNYFSVSLVDQHNKNQLQRLQKIVEHKIIPMHNSKLSENNITSNKYIENNKYRNNNQNKLYYSNKLKSMQKNHDNDNQNRDYKNYKHQVQISYDQQKKYRSKQTSPRKQKKITEQQERQEQFKQRTRNNSLSNSNYHNHNNHHSAYNNGLQTKIIVNRYNNFIKNLKQRFGISSTIIGKQLIVQE